MSKWSQNFTFPESDQSDPRFPFYFFSRNLYIILPSIPGSPKWSLFLRFLHQNTVCVSKKWTGNLNTNTNIADILLLFMHHFKSFQCTGLFISPSGISELHCATTKTDMAERSISIGRESLQVYFILGALAYFQVPPLGGSREEKWRSQW